MWNMLTRRCPEWSYCQVVEPRTRSPWTGPRENQWPRNSKEAYSGLESLADALKNFSKSREGGGRGRGMGFPDKDSHSALRVYDRLVRPRRP